MSYRLFFVFFFVASSTVGRYSLRVAASAKKNGKLRGRNLSRFARFWRSPAAPGTSAVVPPAVAAFPKVRSFLNVHVFVSARFGIWSQMQLCKTRKLQGTAEPFLGDSGSGGGGG